ncbi:MAG: hypothetical protein KF805_05660 [Phycisphaeraceae bacterium]|nr:hypothetical protein [Phycisphaeraceae bacterium]
MSAFVMQSGSENFGAGVVESVQRILFRLAAALVIVLLVMLFLVLFVPLVIIWIVYVTARSAAAGLTGRAHRAGAKSSAHAPIPDADGEGRENVRVRRPNDA